MAGDYDKLTPALLALALLERFKLYSGAAYKADGTLTEQAGLGEGGVDFNFTAYKADFVACIQMGQALVAQLFENNPPRAVARLSATTFSDPGNRVADYPANRALVLAQTSPGVGYVAGSVYDAGQDRTVVTVEGLVVDAGLTECVLGLDPQYAPRVVIPEVPPTDPAQLEYLLW